MMHHFAVISISERQTVSGVWKPRGELSPIVSSYHHAIVSLCHHVIVVLFYPHTISLILFCDGSGRAMAGFSSL